jgi:hypothetical protein
VNQDRELDVMVFGATGSGAARHHHVRCVRRGLACPFASCERPYPWAQARTDHVVAGTVLSAARHRACAKPDPRLARFVVLVRLHRRTVPK